MNKRRRISEGVLVALITAGGTIAASVVTGGFGLVGSSKGQGPAPGPTVTVTVREPGINTAEPSAQPSEAPSPSGPAVYLADMEPVQDSDSWDGDNLSTKSVMVKGTTYSKALVAPYDSVCSYSHNSGITEDYVLSRRYRHFRATVGLADDSPQTSPLNFVVYADDKRVKTVSNVTIAKPQKVDVSVEGVSRIRLVIELSESDTCAESVGVWADPRVSP